jgi:hypothetical protein
MNFGACIVNVSDVRRGPSDSRGESNIPGSEKPSESSEEDLGSHRITKQYCSPSGSPIEAGTLFAFDDEKQRQSAI